MAKAGRSRVPVKLEAAGDTHIGGRTHNEDAILLRPDLNLFLVADGAGGQNAGNVAASLAITTIAHFFEQTHQSADALPAIDGLGLRTAARRLSAAVQDANVEILEIAKSSDKHKGMGTTIVAALFEHDHRLMHIAYVGDSRCYRLRADRLEQLTHDHSFINDVLELRPNIADERVKKLPKNVITRALGMMENLRVSVRTYEVAHGDKYLLCSDGISDNVEDNQISESLALDIGCDEQVALLISMALEAGTTDNVAAVIVDCALPHASRRPSTSTRPVKKKSRPKLPRVDLRSVEANTELTEESVPEIVLYDRPESRDSSPLIHVVPAASPPEVVTQLQTVMEEEQITQEYHSPLVNLRDVADPTGGEPPLRGASSRDSATKVMEVDHAALRQVAGALPDPVSDDPTEDPPTRAFDRRADEDPDTAVKKPAKPARANTKAKSKATTKTKTKTKANTKTKTRSKRAGTKTKPLTPGLGTARTARTTMKPGSMGRGALPARGKGKASARSSTATDGTERGGAAAVRATKSSTNVSAPRLKKPDVSDEQGHRTGDTESPGASEAPPAVEKEPRKSPPPFPTGGRATLTGPGPEPPEIDDTDGLPLPPVREPFDTSDFTNDSVPCHACGSIIMRTADLCMYCGAPTGFITQPD